MSTRERTPNRRRVLAAGTLALAGGLALGARAGAKTPKADVKYQFQPHGTEHCGKCASFLRGPDPKGPGTCKIVDGPIPLDGWCVLFSPHV
jgi:hypothetical protein